VSLPISAASSLAILTQSQRQLLRHVELGDMFACCAKNFGRRGGLFRTREAALKYTADPPSAGRPYGDNLLAQKIALELFELDALKIAP
jgi:hypothetical protein